MEKIDFIKIIEKPEPEYVEVFLLTSRIDSDKRASFFDFQIKDENIVIDFVNLWNEFYESNLFFNKISEFNLQLKDQHIQSLIDYYINEPFESLNIKKMTIDGYYDKFGIKHHVLINKAFSPFSQFVLYHQDGKTNLSEYDGYETLYYSPYRSFNVNENSDSEYFDTYIIDEDQDFYYCSFTPIRLIYNGFSIPFGSIDEHENFTIKIDKKTLKVSSEKLDDIFKDIYVKNFTMNL
jgi:hypothetical protein